MVRQRRAAYEASIQTLQVCLELRRGCEREYRTEWVAHPLSTASSLPSPRKARNIGYQRHCTPAEQQSFHGIEGHQRMPPSSSSPQTPPEPSASKQQAIDKDDPSVHASVASHDRQGAISPSSEKNKRKESDQRSSQLKRSRARQPNQNSGICRAEDSDFQRDPAHQAGRLWTPGEGASGPRRTDARRSREKDGADLPRAGSNRSFKHPRPSDFDNAEVLIKQLETRPISQEQLVAEVKGIYAGLVMVESKCIEVDNAQSSNNETNPKLHNEQWQSLIALHRTLLHEHHDFFLASQHPSASPALRRLASKYAMPARMWRHGIHSFLELLRHRLPASLEHMLTFIYLAYSMMALLYETVPTFEDTWIECLGDLGRYRMAIEDDDLKDREVWTSVSRHWYSKASDKAPQTGRLYHHLAILARPNALQQLFYYTKSLCVPVPFLSARESIMTLFDPHLNGTQTRLQDIDAAFVRAHAILFSCKNTDQLASSINEFIDSLDNHIARHTRRWLDSAYYISIALGCSLLEYGSESNPIMRAIKSGRADDADVPMEGAETVAAPTQKFLDALDFAARTHDVVLRRFGDENIRPYLHVTLSLLQHLSQFPAAMGLIEEKMPWKLIALLLNTIMPAEMSLEAIKIIESEDFPRPDKGEPRPLPDDFAQRGLLWVDKSYPSDWFTATKVDDDEKYFEVASMMEERSQRCLWLGCRLATSGKWLTYDEEAKQFGVVSQFDVEIPDLDASTPLKGDNSDDVIIPDALASDD
ncbi:uncharacterized protein CCOS01_16973 [Colletotrichum costaricense]|uniref:DNA/RNA-binding domain-containing protein n=1 Tax=Colletotrichum costaricense TaxID=1209916 RepID=A0AAJ0DS09_9PEZI|nr:uncharacterized protein CCOS01_16973 [Colletotrichum costaricense]KAK1503898.1 hypothetical protein CCOS01_16973 [Colletotrichum costaricense]